MPGVLLEQKREGIVVLEQLDAMRRIDVPRPSKRQATSGVVAVGDNVVVRPLLSSPFGIGKIKGFGSAFGICQGFALSSPRSEVHSTYRRRASSWGPEPSRPAPCYSCKDSSSDR